MEYLAAHPEKNLQHVLGGRARNDQQQQQQQPPPPPPPRYLSRDPLSGRLVADDYVEHVANASPLGNQFVLRQPQADRLSDGPGDAGLLGYLRCQNDVPFPRQKTPVSTGPALRRSSGGSGREFGRRATDIDDSHHDYNKALSVDSRRGISLVGGSGVRQSELHSSLTAVAPAPYGGVKRPAVTEEQFSASQTECVEFVRSGDRIFLFSSEKEKFVSLLSDFRPWAHEPSQLDTLVYPSTEVPDFNTGLYSTASFADCADGLRAGLTSYGLNAGGLCVEAAGYHDFTGCPLSVTFLSVNDVLRLVLSPISGSPRPSKVADRPLICMGDLFFICAMPKAASNSPFLNDHSQTRLFHAADDSSAVNFLLTSQHEYKTEMQSAPTCLFPYSNSSVSLFVLQKAPDLATFEMLRDDFYHTSANSDVGFVSTDIAPFLRLVHEAFEKFWQRAQEKFSQGLANDGSSPSPSSSDSDADSDTDSETELSSSPEAVAKQRKKCLSLAVASALDSLPSMRKALWTAEALSKKETRLRLEHTPYRIRNLDEEFLVVDEGDTFNPLNFVNEKQRVSKGEMKNCLLDFLEEKKEKVLLTDEGLNSLNYNLKIKNISNPSNSLWILLSAIRPPLPLWSYKESQLLQSPISTIEFQYKTLLQTKSSEKQSLKYLPPTLPLYVQEMLLVEELMFCFMGFCGELIQYKYCVDEVKLYGDHCKSTFLPSKDVFPSVSLPSVPLSLRDGRVPELLESKSQSPLSTFFTIKGLIDERIPVDLSLSQMTEKILSIARVYKKLCLFTELHWSLRFGLSSQALAEVFTAILTEFQQSLARIQASKKENRGHLSLQALWCYLQPAAASFRVLEKIVDAAKYKKGGALLDAIHSVSRSFGTSGEPLALCNRILQQSAKPWSAMLARWIYEGVVDDRYGEFFISADPEITPNTSEVRPEEPISSAQEFASQIKGHPMWFRKFTLLRDAVPEFMRSVMSQAFSAGRDLTVLHTVNNQSMRETEQKVLANPLSRAYLQLVSDAAQAASSKLLKCVMISCDFWGHLASLRRFIFFAKSDFLITFLNHLEEELKSQSIEKTAGRLNYLLKTAIASSSTAEDSYKDNFHCTVSRYLIREISRWFHCDQRIPAFASLLPESTDGDAFITHEKVMLASGHDGSLPASLVSTTQSSSVTERLQELLKYMTLTFDFKWPLSLVFTRIAVIKYQLLSRLVVQLRYTEKKLNEVWQIQMRTREFENSSQKSQKNFRDSNALRLGMMHFVRNILFYVSLEVLEPCMHQLCADLREAESVDKVLELHSAFLDRCLKETLTTEPELIRSLSKVLTVCHLYTNTAIKFSSYRLQTALAKSTASSLLSQSTGRRPRVLAQSNLGSSLYFSMSEDKYQEIVQQYALHYNRNLCAFLKLLIAKSNLHWI